MLEFYAWPMNARLLITFFFAICVLFQTASFVLSRYRHDKTRLHRYESLLELAILGQILCLSLLHGHVYMEFDMGSVSHPEYDALRMLVFDCVAALAVLICAKSRIVWPLLTMLSAFVTLPVAETLLGKAYPYCFLLSLLFLLVRSGHLSLLRYQEIKTGLSAFSVKEAIDNLHTGILFGRPDGRIILMNARMQQLMTDISGTVYRNGRQFYTHLLRGSFSAQRESNLSAGQDVFLLPDGSVWHFTKSELFIKGRACVQLTATDVTARFALTAKLKEQDAVLREKSEEIKSTIAQLHILSHEREAQRAKMRAHDVLGQRLSLILRMMCDGQATDTAMLKSLPEGLLEALATDPVRPSPAAELESLAHTFGAIGVSIRQNGPLPEDEEKAHIFLEVIRESVTNAVRHGFATEVTILSYTENERVCLRVDNNGHAPQGPIVEGGGISALRRKLGERGGTVELRSAPRFTLLATLPGGAI